MVSSTEVIERDETADHEWPVPRFLHFPGVGVDLSP